MKRTVILFGIVFLTLIVVPGEHSSAEAGRLVSPECYVLDADPDPPLYYRIDLKTTRKVPGARMATGIGNVTYAPSPFGVSISPSGTYVYDLDISVERIASHEDKAYAVWVTTPDLKQVKLLGSLNQDHRISGRVNWNKFLLVVSLESKDDIGERWAGPIVLRGMSRSGLMHTMAGHGPFETEPCAVYGYN